MTPKQRDHHRDGISFEDRWKSSGGKNGKRWLAKVRDTRLQRYKCKSFSDMDAAKDWAKKLRARFDLSESNAGKWPLEDVLAECVANMRREGRNETYRKEMERHGRMLQSVGVRDLSDDNLPAKMRLYLDLPTSERHRRHAGPQAAASTVRVRYGFIRTLVSFAIRFMGMQNDPLAKFHLSDRSSKEAIARTSDQETYTLEEIRLVLQLDRRDDQIWLGFILAIYTGLRAFELAALRWESIDWSTRTLRVERGKGNKTRVVSLQPDIHDFLRELGGPGAERPRIGPVCAFKAARLEVRQLHPLLDLVGVTWDRGTSQPTGLPRRLTWHACRRTCAAASLACGVDSLDIQRSLDHEEMDLTGEYAGAFTRWKAMVSEEGWPRGRLCFLQAPTIARNTPKSQNAGN
jgi:integrase